MATKTIDFDVPARALSRRTDPGSSRAAAEKIASKVSGQCAYILALITVNPGCTAGELAQADQAAAEEDDDWAERSPLTQVTICKRVSVLKRKGLIEYGPERECSVRRNLARTYVATESEASHG